MVILGSAETAVCAYCGTEEEVDFVCGGCLKEAYCSCECQRLAWKGHKLYCGQDFIVLDDSSSDSVHTSTDKPSSQDVDSTSSKPSKTISEDTILDSGARVVAYFKLPNGCKSASPMDGIYEDGHFARTATIFFDFGVLQEVPRSWIVEAECSVSEKDILDAKADVPTTASSCSEEAESGQHLEHHDFEDMEKMERRRRLDKERQRASLLELGRILQAQKSHSVRKDAMKVRKQHIEKVREEERLKQRLEEERRRKEDEERRRQQAVERKRLQEEQAERRKLEEERRKELEQRRRERDLAKAILAAQEAERMAALQREKKQRQELQRKHREDMERLQEAQRKALEEERKQQEAERREAQRRRTMEENEERRRHRLAIKRTYDEQVEKQRGEEEALRLARPQQQAGSSSSSGPKDIPRGKTETPGRGQGDQSDLLVESQAGTSRQSLVSQQTDQAYQSASEQNEEESDSGSATRQDVPVEERLRAIRARVHQQQQQELEPDLVRRKQQQGLEAVRHQEENEEDEDEESEEDKEQEERKQREIERQQAIAKEAVKAKCLAIIQRKKEQKARREAAKERVLAALKAWQTEEDEESDSEEEVRRDSPEEQAAHLQSCQQRLQQLIRERIEAREGQDMQSPPGLDEGLPSAQERPSDLGPGREKERPPALRERYLELIRQRQKQKEAEQQASPRDEEEDDEEDDEETSEEEEAPRDQEEEQERALRVKERPRLLQAAQQRREESAEQRKDAMPNWPPPVGARLFGGATSSRSPSAPPPRSVPRPVVPDSDPDDEDSAEEGVTFDTVLNALRVQLRSTVQEKAKKAEVRETHEQQESQQEQDAQAQPAKAAQQESKEAAELTRNLLKAREIVERQQSAAAAMAKKKRPKSEGARPKKKDPIPSGRYAGTQGKNTVDRRCSMDFLWRELDTEDMKQRVAYLDGKEVKVKRTKKGKQQAADSTAAEGDAQASGRLSKEERKKAFGMGKPRSNAHYQRTGS